MTIATYTGPCACPECGFDDRGDLHVVDWYDELHPPIPPLRHPTLTIWGDDPEMHGSTGMTYCPVCETEWDAATMTPRVLAA